MTADSEKDLQALKAMGIFAPTPYASWWLVIAYIGLYDHRHKKMNRSS